MKHLKYFEKQTEKLYKKIDNTLDKENNLFKDIVDINDGVIKKMFPKMHFLKVGRSDRFSPLRFSSIKLSLRIWEVRDEYFYIEEVISGFYNYYLIDGYDGLKQFFTDKI